MSSHGYDSEDRPPVSYVDDESHAYVLLRYRQCHDFYHVLYGLPPDVLGEVALKAIEVLEFRLGGAALQALGGAGLVLAAEERRTLLEVYVPWFVRLAADKDKRDREGGEGGGLISVFFERELETDLDELRRRLYITPVPTATGVALVSSKDAVPNLPPAPET